MVFHSKIRESVQKALKLELGGEIEKAKTLVRDNISSIKLHDNIYLKGNLDKLEPSSVYTTDGFINVNAIANGTMQVNIK